MQLRIKDGLLRRLLQCIVGGKQRHGVEWWEKRRPRGFAKVAWRAAIRPTHVVQGVAWLCVVSVRGHQRATYVSFIGVTDAFWRHCLGVRCYEGYEHRRWQTW